MVEKEEAQSQAQEARVQARSAGPRQASTAVLAAAVAATSPGRPEGPSPPRGPRRPAQPAPGLGSA